MKFHKNLSGFLNFENIKLMPCQSEFICSHLSVLKHYNAASLLLRFLLEKQNSALAYEILTYKRKSVMKHVSFNCMILNFCSELFKGLLKSIKIDIFTFWVKNSFQANLK